MDLLTDNGSGERVTPRPSVLILSFEYPPKAGAGVHVFELATGLSRAGFEVTIVAPTTGPAGTLREQNLTVHLVAPSAETCARVAHLSTVQGVLALHDDLLGRVHSLISEEGLRPNVIHCHDWYTYKIARTIGQLLGVPVIGTVHSTSEPIVRWWGELPDPEVVEQEAALYRNADALIMVSRSMRDIIKGVYRLSDERMRVIHNGFDPTPFMRQSFNPKSVSKLRQTVSRSDEKIIIYAGRLTLQKGLGALLASATRVIEQHPKACYLLVGEPDSRNSAQMIEQLLQQYPQLRTKVKMLGRVARKQLAMLYQVADVAVIPSVYEPFGYAAIEALSACVPVIATAVGGLTEIIEHGKSGLLVPVRPHDARPHEVDVEELTAAQLMLLSDQGTARRIGEGGRDRVLEQFTLERMIQATMQLYSDVLSRFHRPPVKDLSLPAQRLATN